MGRSKQKKFAQVSEFPNVIELSKGENAVNDFIKAFTKETQVIIELGCGKGEYTTGLAKMYPNLKIIGVDIQGERIWAGAKYLLENDINNAVFVRGYVDKILEYFKDIPVSEIWLTFPDPFPKDRHERRRLTSPDFLNKYKQILIPGGCINLKTDNDQLFLYTLEIIQNMNLKIINKIEDVHSKEDINDELKIETTFEKKHRAKGSKIYFIKFKF